MPLPTVYGQSGTPTKVRYSFDNIVVRLNTLGLQIPSLRGTQETALEQADAADSLAKKCAGQIRFLCFRDCNLEKLISEFEDEARRRCSEWVFKPSQEEGTLPQIPITTSFITRTPDLLPKNRESLLQILSDHLRDDVQLAKASDFYKRTSFTDSRDNARPIQVNESQIRTSVGQPQATTAMVTRPPATQRAFNHTDQGISPMKRSGEAGKRKSSGTEKV
jgi:hypothetical protein